MFDRTLTQVGMCACMCVSVWTLSHADEDGTFWMPYEKFASIFNMVQVGVLCA